MTSVVGSVVVSFHFSVRPSARRRLSPLATGAWRRPLLLPTRIDGVPPAFSSFSLFLSFSFSTSPRLPTACSSFLRSSPLGTKKRGRFGPHNNETEIVHRIYISPPRARRDTPLLFFMSKSPDSCESASDGGNILSLFNLVAARSLVLSLSLPLLVFSPFPSSFSRARCLRQMYVHE